MKHFFIDLIPNLISSLAAQRSDPSCLAEAMLFRPSLSYKNASWPTHHCRRWTTSEEYEKSRPKTVSSLLFCSLLVPWPLWWTVSSNKRATSTIFCQLIFLLAIEILNLKIVVALNTTMIFVRLAVGFISKCKKHASIVAGEQYTSRPLQVDC